MLFLYQSTSAKIKNDFSAFIDFEISVKRFARFADKALDLRGTSRFEKHLHIDLRDHAMTAIIKKYI